MAAPKLRWLRFGLRAIFVVFTVLAVWLGWTASIVHQRKALLASLSKGGCYSVADHAHLPKAPIDHSYSMMDVYAANAVGHATDYSFHQPAAHFSLSRIRQWMGDEPRYLIAYRPGPDIEVVQRVFPETLILLVEPRGGERGR